MRFFLSLTWVMSWLEDSPQVLEWLSSCSNFVLSKSENLTHVHTCHSQDFALAVVPRLRILELHCLLAPQYVMFFIFICLSPQWWLTSTFFIWSYRFVWHYLLKHLNFSQIDVFWSNYPIHNDLRHTVFVCSSRFAD